MDTPFSQPYSVYADDRRLALGDLSQVAAAAKHYVERDPNTPVLVFDNRSSQVIDIDYRGNVDDVAARYDQPIEEPTNHTEAPPKRGRGRPKLGVVAREVTLLPRHWEWLRQQPGGASVALRKLVEQARRDNQGNDERRAIQTAVYRFMTTMASHLPEYEEALRALYAEESERFFNYIRHWPVDLREHIEWLSQGAFSVETD